MVAGTRIGSGIEVPEGHVVGTGAVIAMWGGRIAFAAFLFSGGSHLWPVPPALDQELHALFVCFAAMVPLAIGEFIAAYLAMLATTSQLADVQKLQGAVLGLLADAPDTLKKMSGATIDLLRQR
jgi:hypothetical protein